MRKILILVSLLALTLVSVSPPPPDGTLTIENRSPLAIQLKLVSQKNAKSKDSPTESWQYEFLIPAGPKGAATIQKFSLARARYALSAQYVEYYDPVYGFQCTSKSMTLVLERPVYLLFFGCNVQPPNRGEPQRAKFSGGGGKRSGGSPQPGATPTPTPIVGGG